MRQIEVGLASLLSVAFGLTVSAFGVSMRLGRQFPRWLAWLGLAGGLGTVAAGVARAYTGFSAFAMAVSMSATFVLLLWAIAVGSYLWRLALRPAPPRRHPSTASDRRKRAKARTADSVA